VRFRSLMAWFFLVGGALLLVEGGSSIFYYLMEPAMEYPLPFEQSTSRSQPIASTQPASPPVPTESLAAPASSPTTVVPQLPVGTKLFRLTFPRLRTSLNVVEGTNKVALRKGPGHLEGSVLPGEAGNSVVTAHRDTHFRVLRNIKKGDEIQIERNGKRYLYRVKELMVVSRHDTATIRPSTDTQLTLVTCYPFSFFGPAPRRFVVKATPVAERPSISALRVR
jgi:sortase A